MFFFVFKNGIRNENWRKKTWNPGWELLRMKEEAPRSTSWINIVLTLIWQSAWNHHKLYFFTFACFHPIVRWEPTVEILRDAINCVVSPGIVNLIQTDSGIVAHAFPSRQCHCQMSLHNKLWSCFNNSPFPPLLTALFFQFHSIYNILCCRCHLSWLTRWYSILETWCENRVKGGPLSLGWAGGKVSLVKTPGTIRGKVFDEE